MKNMCFMLLLVLAASPAMAQIYVDPLTAAATATHAGLINNQLNSTNEKLSLVQKAQLAVTVELGAVNTLQANIYRGLSEVSGIMRSLLAVEDIYSISSDILQDLNKGLAIAKSDPVLLLFAQSGSEEFKSRALRLASEVSSFVLAGGKDNLMDAGERAKLLNRIVNELSILRGVACGMYRAMFWAKQRGIWNALNPYSGFINIDKNIANQILFQAKTLRQ